MFFVNLNQDDVSPSLTEWESILEQFNDSVTEDELWELAKTYQDMPHFGNLYQFLVMEKLADRFCTLVGKDRDEISGEYRNEYFFDSDVNAIASSFYIDGESIDCKEDFFSAIERFNAEQEEDDE